MRRLILDTLSGTRSLGPQPVAQVDAPRLMPRACASRQPRSIATSRSASAQPRWDAVWNHAVAAEKLVDPARRDYYQAEVLTMITINRESNRALLLVAKALQDDEAGHPEKAKRSRRCPSVARQIQHSMSAAEYGKWKNWYRGDWLTGVYRTRELVQDYANHLKDPMAKLPAPVSWSGWEAYFHIMQYEGDRSVDVH